MGKCITHSFYDDGFDAFLLTRLLHLLRRLDAVEVVDGDVAALGGEGCG